MTGHILTPMNIHEEVTALRGLSLCILARRKFSWTLKNLWT